MTDADIAFDAASRFETARAGGQWADAWDLLAPSSQSAARSLQEFTLAEVAYNAEGGTAFIVTEPSRDPGLVEQLVGERRALIATEADLERAWVVLITHPGQTTAAAAARAYLVAPLRVGGEWRLWPLR